ncbi:wax ester/triacylglycerol synthase family O-acyltransferase [Rhodococcus artemisiae]|uniref:Diacylglycerol O-acyltransferase n=1 Tax=Rhodococcus artemisiae TaxID=714159 RepID=A0ABU7LIH1_9NOCA|nr:wax ester/triacylglycerol synthase family O-acyltransferase [Rhodococcus artemisiae]MEE2061363.1 wax ester/triacylglycerol synthase family O-acyltransferase [Rhodococcus artemisiae]
MDDNLSFLDAGFLETEDSDPHASLTIGALAIMEGPCPGQGEFRDTVAARLATLPHTRDRIRTVPLDFSAPSWSADPHFDLGHHLRRVALPESGEQAQLFDLVARVMALRLDRDHPLWECWVVEGLTSDRWAVLTKIHHCMADGITGTKLFEAMCDEVEADTGIATPPAVDASGELAPTLTRRPDSVESLVRSAIDLLSPTRQLRLISATMSIPRRLTTAGLGVAEGLTRLLSEMLTSSTDTSLIGPIGRQRRYCGVRVRMCDVREICTTYRVTVNDVALAAITNGLRKLLSSRGERPEPHTVRTLVPVSVRSSTEEGVIHNRISLMLPFLPVDIEDPVEQLVAVHDRLTTHKASKEAEGGKAFTAAAQYGPFMPMAWVVRLATRFPQRSVVAVATNVPGPKTTRHVMGRTILEIFPYVPIALRLRIGIAILSYADHLAFGLTGDYDTTPDLTDLSVSIEQGILMLLAAARAADAPSE